MDLPHHTVPNMTAEAGMTGALPIASLFRLRPGQGINQPLDLHAGMM
jgi:hypothetical protein